MGKVVDTLFVGKWKSTEGWGKRDIISQCLNESDCRQFLWKKEKEEKTNKKNKAKENKNKNKNSRCKVIMEY